ncbi:MAG TPA: GNAT family N-acetyltransferase [Candidatus Fimimorpha excrementavium]|nr:GNAT family N-acetyltransferase [Candidatus Fimimorpha excrementavium]
MEHRKGKNDQIRYLAEEEKMKSKPLWNQCFPEDSPAFVSYYYREKTKNNRILVKMEGDAILTMLHRNPYALRWKDTQWTADYIVGVATKRDRRHEGHMREVLTRGLLDMNREHRPFAFLMPAAEEIYHPFSFRYVEKKEEVFLNPQMEPYLERKPVMGSEKECQKIGAWMEQWLEKNYDMFTIRNAEYVKHLLMELESEHGGMDYLMDRGVCVGLQAFWGSREREQRLLYADGKWCQMGNERPRIMARITDLSAFLSAFRLSEKGELTVELTVRDGQIPENSGNFVWKITGQGSVVRRAEAKRPGTNEERITLSADIAELAEWLFGYRLAETIWEERAECRLSKLKQIQTMGSVFLDEVV